MDRLPSEVSATELARNLGHWLDRLIKGPVRVTRHGRTRSVMLSADAYAALSGTSHDRRGEAADSAGRLNLLIDKLHEGFVAVDRDWRITHVNLAAETFRRETRMELIGRDFFEATPMLVGSFVEERLRLAMDVAEASDFEAPSVINPGRRTSVRIFPYPGGAAILFRDVTHEREARRIGQDQASFRAALRANGDCGVARLNLRGRLTFAHESLKTLLGIEPARLDEVRLVDLLPADRRPALRDALEDVLTGKGPRALDTEMLARGTERIPVRIGIAEVRYDFAIEGATVAISRRREDGGAGETETAP